MPKLVQKSGYIKAGRAGGYMKYIATRERVEKLEGSGPVTKNQQELIAGLLRDFPDTKELHEYADYTAAPTLGNASALITMALDINAEDVQDRKGYMEYISTRPRVERCGEHGLFGSMSSVSLNTALQELDAHEGNVWTLIWSLRREDAARFGYDHAAAWRALLRSKQAELATAMKISPDKLRWYAAFHNEDTHPHIHAMVWSDDSKQGYLTPEGIEKMRSTLTNEIFRDEMLQLYQEKDRSYKELAHAARETMRDLIRGMKENFCDSPEAEHQLMELSMLLASTKGKKQYQYLKKPVKEKINKVVDAIAALPQVAKCYEGWNLLKDELDGYYHDTPRERLPLSQQKEFRAIKNMIIREAMQLNEMTFEDEGMEDEPDHEDELFEFSDQWLRAYYHAKEVLCDDSLPHEEKTNAVLVLERLADSGGAVPAFLLGKAWRNGLCGPPWEEEAEKWFRRAAEAGNDSAQYALGKLLLEQGSNSEGLDWMLRSANQGNEYAMYRLGKEALRGGVIQKDVPWAIPILTDAAERGNPHAQYTLGKLYLQGIDVAQDLEQAEYWLKQAAEQGHRYAQYFLDHMDERRSPSAMLAATRLLHDLGQIFQTEIPPPPVEGIRIDRQRMRQLIERLGYQAAKSYAHSVQEEQENGQLMGTPW